MQIPVKQLKSGFKIPVLGLGTWLMGGDMVRNPYNDDSANIREIKIAIENGLTHIDTAENYAEGWAEKLVGAAIKGFDRNKLFITSKVDKRHLKYLDVLNAANASLERLQTDYIDLYLIHAPSPNDEVPMAEYFKALDELVEKGIVKNIGVSNFSTLRLIEAQKLAKNKIVTNQVYYNLSKREPETDGLLSYCQQNEIILTAYRPLDKGVLLNKIPEIVKKVAAKYNKTPVQIYLNWLISQDNVITISKMAKINHVKENIDAVSFKMENEDIELLRSEFPNQVAKPQDLPLR